MSDFNDADVRRVAEFVQSKSGCDQWDDFRDWTPRYYCSLCDTSLLQRLGPQGYYKPDLKKFKHRPDCLYLVAQDLLTEAP